MIRFTILLYLFTIGTIAFAQHVGQDGLFNPNKESVGADGLNNSVSTASPPPNCTNKLDFSVACNSQYIPLF